MTNREARKVAAALTREAEGAERLNTLMGLRQRLRLAGLPADLHCAVLGAIEEADRRCGV